MRPRRPEIVSGAPYVEQGHGSTPRIEGSNSTDPLLAHHREHLHGSGISDEVIASTGYFSVESTLQLVGYGWGSSRRLPQLLPALAIPVRGAASEADHVVYAALRPDAPQSDTNGKVCKYEHPPKSTTRLDVHPTQRQHLRDRSVPLWFTEGVKKRDALVSIDEFAISIQGVYGWKGAEALTDLDAVVLRDRDVVIAFDSDMAFKHDVREAAIRFRNLLTMRGARVRYLVLEGGSVVKQGVDDFLAVGHTRGDLEARLRDDLPVTPSRAGALDDLPRCTDLGNGQRFAGQHGDDVRYCYAYKEWLTWDGSRWRRSEASGDVERRAKQTARSIFDEAKNAVSQHDREVIGKWAVASQSASRLAAMLTTARSEARIEIAVERLDGDSWLLNTPSGTVDLRTGRRRDHDRADLITKITAAPYEPAAECPRWLAFLHETFDGDEALIEHVQRIAGYALTGDVREHLLFLFYGGGRNGKGTLVNTMLKLLGDYAYVADPKILLSRKGDAHPTDIAALQGQRLVVCFETDRDRYFNEAVVKNLTGADGLNARALYQNPFKFFPTHTLVLVSNHLPDISGKDEGIWSRMHVVPFTVTITEDRKDSELMAKLEAEWAGILRWAVEGCLSWQRDGLRRPESVVDASTAYREEMAEPDDVDCFIAKCCELDAAATVPMSDLRYLYTIWAHGEHREVLTDNAFGRALTSKGFRLIKASGGARLRVGLRTLDHLMRARNASTT